MGISTCGIRGAGGAETGDPESRLAPFGATFGDFLTKPVAEGGINLGTVGSSLFFGVVLAFAIARKSKLEKGRLATAEGSV